MGRALRCIECRVYRSVIDAKAKGWCRGQGQGEGCILVARSVLRAADENDETLIIKALKAKTHAGRVT